ncbi:helix-turn-helix DNA-binding domain protein [Mycobacterium phage BuzzBuzz]|uniref:RNA polymerase sigma factor n=8 Tax=Mycobacterium phage Bxz2 TaxID=205870 RepID=R4JFL4_BPMB2|nr:hypothetical protein PBI_METHUSELAH_53 [Mycobacterium phage Methuselah]AIM51197.1 putative sigma factor [Mycobacterium phage Farber]AJA41840.1 putative sigma factor [Mycobacterium phage Spike509]AJA41931.1 putative sigma factor [Mycobacterium phage Phoxy]ANU79390.1 helix-turn-helix DNA-binding domain protein [Mycobacterium phage BuzzBuzz]AOZ64828.1 helix-turn-helix DNA binding domain protein [Mycobacterium phage Louie6]ASM62474.1 HTH DNA binding domain protein [Mycobacterium phage KADY]AX
MTENKIERLSKPIRRAAKIVASQWPGVIEADDLEQTLYLKLLESPGTVDKALALEPKAKDRFLVRMGHQIASQERTDYAYYKGSYRYSLAEVKKLLKSGALKGLELDPEVQTYDSDGGKPQGGESKPPINAAVLDLRAALEALRGRNEAYADALVKRYLFDEFAETKSEEDALRRGTEALTDEMNRVRRVEHVTRDDGPGTRQSVRRESARYVSKSQWDNDAPVLPAQYRDNAVEKEVWE